VKYRTHAIATSSPLSSKKEPLAGQSSLAATTAATTMAQKIVTAMA
jgi:hypothetical protein